MKQVSLGRPRFYVGKAQTVEFGRRKSGQGDGGAEPGPTWILSTGEWNDAGVWDDAAEWRDSP